MNAEILVCAFCGAEHRSDLDGCTNWRAMDYGGQRFMFCPKEFPAEGAPAEAFAAAKKRAQDRVVELMAARKCRVCGCTEDRACVTPAGPCHWVAPDLCSGCCEDADLSAADIEALEALPPIAVQMHAVTALQIMAALQLVCRHPAFQGSSRKTVEEFARALQGHVSITPNLAAVCEAGWDPEQDVPPTQEPAIIVPGDPRFGV